MVLTVDAPAHGKRDRERRAGCVLRPGVSAVNLASAPPVATPAAPTGWPPEWPPEMPPKLPSSASALCNGLLQHAAS